MALFVRVFRLAMLFFNAYDSYKVLKLPPPSSRNRGKPSLRALSQRKRDMKGCLAIWIVWCCFITYERFVEAIISLFIPFYDEFKSLAMLFLIMTRARGAEPIYLHIIRPFLKPYTSTIDQVLDFARVIGDIVFGLVALPFVYALKWWTYKFGSQPESLDAETEASSSPRISVSQHKTRPPIRQSSTSKSVGKSEVGEYVNGNSHPSIPTTTISNGQVQSKKHEIWVPPASARHSDDEGEHLINNAPPSLPQDSQPHSNLNVDEWRQYPAFPSAYPPTPLTKQTEILATTIGSTVNDLFPSIPEETRQQDFHESLLSLHDPSNPSHANGLSDENVCLGVQPDIEQVTISVMDVDDPNETMNETDEYESEDEFNITLRTPDVSIVTSLKVPIDTSLDGLSPLSFVSKSSPLSTTNHDSSLRTISPVASSPSTSDSSMAPSVLIGRKRPLQDSVKNLPSTRAVRMSRSPKKRGFIQRPQVRTVSVAAAKKTFERAPAKINMTNEDSDITSKRRRLSDLSVTSPGNQSRRISQDRPKSQPSIVNLVNNKGPRSSHIETLSSAPVTKKVRKLGVGVTSEKK